MPVSTEITTLIVEDELHICPACGYEFGFHTSFINMNAEKDNPVKSTREVFRVILICPECGARYDVGWRVSFYRTGKQGCEDHGPPGRSALTSFLKGVSKSSLAYSGRN